MLLKIILPLLSLAANSDYHANASYVQANIIGLLRSLPFLALGAAQFAATVATPVLLFMIYKQIKK